MEAVASDRVSSDAASGVPTKPFDIFPHIKYMARNGGLMSKKRIPLGTSNFKTLIQENSYFVDKSLFIKDVVQGSQVLLFARPRRFGKTLNLSMLKYFYNNQGDNAGLFKGLNIAKEPEIMQKQGKHPVIYLTMKDVKQETREGCFENIFSILNDLVKSFSKILNSDLMSGIDIKCCQRILADTASEVDYANSLKTLSKAIYHHYNLKPVILIDEYDTPILVGHASDFYKDIISFMRVFLGGALKDNEYLEKAVLTGILRVSKESMFSGLNNIDVCTVTSHISADKFGFLESEVAVMLHHYDDIFSLADVKYWYDGYNFGGSEIYNPWSILRSIRVEKLSTHWVNTSTNDLIKELCQKADTSIKQDLDILTQGGSINKAIDDNIVFTNLSNDEEALWSLLLHSGYLRYDNIAVDEETGSEIADLSLPNSEILCLFKKDIVKNWFTPAPSKMRDLTNMMNNLTSGDIEVFKTQFIDYCTDTLSYFDVTRKTPEKQYHMLLLGVLMCLKDRYDIRSNRESGYGRCDVMLAPRGVRSDGCRGGLSARPNSVGDEPARPAVNRGILFEFKSVNKKRKETFESAIEDAKIQISELKYTQELRSRGCKEIVNIIVAFAGKEMRVVVY